MYFACFITFTLNIMTCDMPLPFGNTCIVATCSYFYSREWEKQAETKMTFNASMSLEITQSVKKKI